VSKQAVIVLKNDLTELARLRTWFNECGGKLSIDPKTLFHLNLVCDELVTNTVMYGYDNAEERQIEICLTVKDDAVELLITDDGVAFNPLSLPAADTALSLDERKTGGLGIHFVKELMDEVRYERIGETNKVLLKKNGRKPAESEGST